MLIKTNFNFYHAFTIIKLLISITILYIVLCFIIPEIKYVPHPKFVRLDNIKIIMKAIDQYYGKFGKYPKYLDYLTKTHPPYLTEIPIDPITGYADWEVAEKNNKNTWYRTTNETYPYAPPQWLPAPESSIYFVKPRYITN